MRDIFPVITVPSTTGFTAVVTFLKFRLKACKKKSKADLRDGIKQRKNKILFKSVNSVDLLSSKARL